MTNLSSQLELLECISCRASLTLYETSLRCTRCQTQFPVVNGAPIMLSQDDMSSLADTKFGAAGLFSRPLLYRIKVNILLKLNKTDDISVEHLLRGKSVLDVGCGPFTYGYNAKLPSHITGIDLSPQFVQSMSEHDPNNFYMVASAGKIPYADNSFDVSLLRFILHHIPGNSEAILREVSRVTRNQIVIIDHVRSEFILQRKIQTAYWAVFDGGYQYYSVQEWDRLLAPYTVTTFRRTGKMFGNICQIILESTENSPRL